MLLLKRHAVISAVRLGDSILFWFVSRRTGCSCQQFLLEEMRYIPALYTVLFPNEVLSPEYQTIALAIAIYFLLHSNLSQLMQKQRGCHDDNVSLNLKSRRKTCMVLPLQSFLFHFVLFLFCFYLIR